MLQNNDLKGIIAFEKRVARSGVKIFHRTSGQEQRENIFIFISKMEIFQYEVTGDLLITISIFQRTVRMSYSIKGVFSEWDKYKDNPYSLSDLSAQILRFVLKLGQANSEEAATYLVSVNSIIQICKIVLSLPDHLISKNLLATFCTEMLDFNLKWQFYFKNAPKNDPLENEFMIENLLLSFFILHSLFAHLSEHGETLTARESIRENENCQRKLQEEAQERK